MTVGATISNQSYSDDDLPALCAFLTYCDTWDKLEDTYSEDDLRVRLANPKINKERDLRLWQADEKIIGFELTRVEKVAEKVEGHFFFRVHPDWREGDLSDQMISWANQRYRQLGQEYNLPVEYDSPAREEFAYNRKVLEKHGFEKVRYFFRMECPLEGNLPELKFPAGFSVRSVQNEADLQAWVETYNASFIDHWNFHPATLEEHKHWLQQSNYDPKGDLLAIDSEGKVAGFCFCWFDKSDNLGKAARQGWIETLGVKRNYRKIGLGRAMLLAGMYQLKAAEMDTALLSVDAENPSGALRIYEAAGFKKRYTSIAYRKII